ncbi:MAG TPA: protein kinase [Kofleriaceae bacterium]|nr:protein kinase [Kofleriaceae bacterium]
MGLPAHLGAGRFDVRRCLGRGGMGTVYEAIDRQTGNAVAIKVLGDLDAQRLYRFKKEFRALADLQHRNLVRLHELIADDDRWIITMELIDGHDLFTYVTRRDTDDTSPGIVPPNEHEFDEDRLRACLAQLAAGVDYLHAAGRIHRDLKPSNVMVDRAGRTVILDFGLIATSEARSSASGHEVVGTAAYMAPEQAELLPVTPAADWYAIGTVLFEIITGTLPFEGGPIDQLLQKTQRDAPRVSSIVPDVPADLDELVAGLLTRDAAKRAGGKELERAGGLRPTRARTARLVTPIPAGPLVGREEELGTLQAVIAATRRGESAAALVVGESGVGKSMLVKELARAVAADPRAIVLSGRCYERESVPYRAFDGVIDDLSSVLARMDADEPDIPLPRDVGALARIFPVLWRAPAVAKVAHHEVGHQLDQRLRAVGALRKVLDRLADRGRVLVVIDDLQWADADSLGLLTELLRDEAPAVALVATVRATGEELPPRLAAAIERVAGLRTIRLGALPAAEARSLAVQLWEEIGGARPIDLDAVVRETGGHPLFLDVMLRHLADGGGSAPIDLDAALSARTAALPADDRRLLEVVAVAGAPLDRRVAADAAGLDRAGIAARADTLVMARLIASRNDALECYHDRVREAVVASLGPGGAATHRALATALERNGNPDPAEVVRHWEAAGETDRAAELAVSAAERAERALAFDQAARLYEVALRRATLSAEEREALEVRRAEALGDAGRAYEGAHAYLAIAERAGATTRLERRRRAAELFLRHGHLDEGLATLSAVLADVGLSLPASPQRALAKLLWTRALLRIGGLRYRQRDEMSASARDVLRVDTFRTVGISLSMVHPVLASFFTAAGLRLALRVGIPARVAGLLQFESMFHSFRGVPSRERALAIVEMSERIIEDRQHGSYNAGLEAGARGLIDYFCGEFPTAAEFLRQGEAVMRAQPAGKGWELTNARVFLLLTMRFLGECRTLTERFHELLRDAERRGDRYAEATLTRALNLVWLVRDDIAGARRAIERRAWSPPAGTFHLQHWYEVRADMETSLYAGELPGHAESILERIDRSDKALLSRVISIYCENEWMRGRIGLMQVARGESRAMGAVDRSIQLLEARRERYAVVWAQFLRAGRPLARGEREDGIVALLEAERLAKAAHMNLMGASAQLRRGQLVGGAEGDQLIALATAWMTGQGIRNPERMARVWCPGANGV